MSVKNYYNFFFKFEVKILKSRLQYRLKKVCVWNVFLTYNHRNRTIRRAMRIFPDWHIF